MFGRKDAYTHGYVSALDDLKAALFNDVQTRLDERSPHTLESLSETVIQTINRLEDEALDTA